MVRATGLVSVLVAAAVLLPIGSASARPVGGCPPQGGFVLTPVTDLGLPEGFSNPSLDKNGDGLTCVKFLPGNGNLAGFFIFRDNTVGP